jgi:hypothetical protein
MTKIFNLTVMVSKSLTQGNNNGGHMNQQTVQDRWSEKNTIFFQRKQLFNTKPLLKSKEIYIC